MQAIGGLFAMSADAVRYVFSSPFQWREFPGAVIGFVARVSLAPTRLVTSVHRAGALLGTPA